jgi:FkbM family methyltransferase
MSDLMAESVSVPARAGLILNALRMMPNVRGKKRVAGMLLSNSARARSYLVRDHAGNRMLLPNLLEQGGLCVAVDGGYELEILRFLENRLKSNSVLVDVGANIGFHTVPLARKTGRVIAIEPSPKIQPYLRQNVQLNGLSNVTIVDCAASLRGNSTVPLYIPPMGHFGMASTAPQFGVEPILVPASPLDTILDTLGISDVTAMKIDVEGYEAHVLLGARNLLSRGTTIIFEFLEWAENRAFPGKAGWAQEILLDAGYRLWQLSQFVRGGPPLRAPLREGVGDIVALRT